jgi:hypothetical protein
MDMKRVEIFLEFLVFGVIMGVIEDLIAIKVATGATIDLRTIVIITLIAIPFAVIGELIVDKTDLVCSPEDKIRRKVLREQRMKEKAKLKNEKLRKKKKK